MELENAFEKEYNVLDYSKQNNEQQVNTQQDQEVQKPYVNNMKSVKENIEREKRIVFIGNISINMTKKQIIKHFKQYGKIEKIWIRSVPVDNAIKLPKKVKIIKDHTVNFCKSKNCYLLFQNEEDAKKCIEQSNNQVLQDRHIHVTQGNHIETDYKTTVFVGNLPYDIDEEDLREFIESKTGQIEYIRLIRDKLTYKGKGIGYIKFKNKEDQEKCLNIKDKFKDRQLRIQKAKKNKLNKNKQQDQNEQQKNYRQRLSLKELKEREEEIKKLSQANLQDNQIIDEQRMEQIYQHKGVIPQNQIKKKIKKLNKKNLTQFQKAQMTDKIKRRANDKLKKDVFENENLLKKRRESIKKKKTMYKRLHKQQQKQTKYK